MSQNPIDRSRLASGRMVGSGTTILLLAVVLAPQIKASDNLALTFLLTAAVFLVIGAILFFITFATARETVIRDVAQVSLKQTLQTVTKNGPLARLCASSLFYLTGQNIISALGIYIANDILSQYAGGNWLASVVTIITTGAVIYVAPFGPLRHPPARQEARFHDRRGGRRRGQLCLFFVSGNLIFALVGLFFLGVGMALLNTMTWALEADTVEYGEYQTGIRTEGATYAAFSFIRKVGRRWAPPSPGTRLAWAGYNGALKGTGRPQDGAVLDRMQQAAGLLPAVCFVVALLIMATYPLTEARFKEIVQGIQARRAQQHRVDADE